MRMRLPFLIAGVLLSQTAMAAPEPTSLSRLDVFYSHTDFSVDGTSGSVKGSGGGIRGWIGRSWPIVTAEYEYSEIDGTIGGLAQDGDVESIRAGLGLRLLEDDTLSVWARAEYLTLDLKLNGVSALDDEGFGVHVGVRAGTREVEGFGEIGGVETEDARGFEGRVGVAYQPANWGMFMEYRLSMLELDPGDTDIELGVARAGVRWIF